MADIDDFDYKSILDVSDDEGIEMLRQIRLRRRVPDKKPKSNVVKKMSTTSIDSSAAAEILKILGVKE